MIQLEYNFHMGSIVLFPFSILNIIPTLVLTHSLCERMQRLYTLYPAHKGANKISYLLPEAGVKAVCSMRLYSKY